MINNYVSVLEFVDMNCVEFAKKVCNISHMTIIMTLVCLATQNLVGVYIV